MATSTWARTTAGGTTGSCASPPAEPEAQERGHGLEAVPPRDLLALVVGPAVVGDRHLVQPDAGRAQNLGGDLRLEAEVVRHELQGADEVAGERLVAELHA